MYHIKHPPSGPIRTQLRDAHQPVIPHAEARLSSTQERPCQHPAAIGAEGNIGDVLLVNCQRKVSARSDILRKIPNRHLASSATGSEPSTVGTENEAIHLLALTGQLV